MKLQAKIIIFVIAILLLLAIPVAVSGYLIINDIVFELYHITTANLRPLVFEQVGPFFYDATCKPSDCALNGIQ